MCVSFISLKYLDRLEDLENVPKIQWLSAAHNPETVRKIYELLAETIVSVVVHCVPELHCLTL